MATLKDVAKASGLTVGTVSRVLNNRGYISCLLYTSHLYEAKYAQNEYEAVRSESRQGFAISSEELKRIDGIISPLIDVYKRQHLLLCGWFCLCM